MFFRRLIGYVLNSWEAHALLERWRHWPWHNTLLLLISLGVFGVLLSTEVAHRLFEQFHSLSYVGVLIAGMLSASIFTMAPAVALLFGFANDLNPYLTALVGGFGAMIGDFVVFHLLRDRVFHELQPVFEHFRSRRIIALFRTPYFAWLLPLMGMVLIATPGPDEVGLGLLGASHIRRWQFLLLTFVLNSAGILLVVLGARIS